MLILITGVAKLEQERRSEDEEMGELNGKRDLYEFLTPGYTTSDSWISIPFCVNKFRQRRQISACHQGTGP